MQQREISQTEIQQRFVDCFNRHPCCEAWANLGECRKNRNYMEQYCRAACHICNSTFDTSN
ncbi:unnamed protein product, partial [Wuchereria bancrofti]